MKINIATLFPQMCESVLNTSIIGRARNAKIVEINTYNIRDYTEDRHNNVDDTPFGGGPGMVMQAQPIYDCCKAIDEINGEKSFIVFTSASGVVLNQDIIKKLSKEKSLTIVCGHYEGIDQRVIDEIGDMEISIGDYVLTGGELPALVITDAVCRMLPGVLKSKEGFTDESHYNGLLEHAQYTKPREWNNRAVPRVLLSGHAKNIEDFRLRDSLNRTKERRPDLYKKYLESNEKRAK
jgi:tRNA (guanine37-N1)-methyltransferase